VLWCAVGGGKSGPAPFYLGRTVRGGWGKRRIILRVQVEVCSKKRGGGEIFIFTYFIFVGRSNGSGEEKKKKEIDVSVLDATPFTLKLVL